MLRDHDLPQRSFGRSGREHEVFQAEDAGRFWKATFPGQSGFGAFGHYTPVGYLRRLRLANQIFGDDVRFEGIWSRREGPSIVTSQTYIHPHPLRFIPTEREIGAFLRKLGFRFDERSRFWEREDGVELCDTHNRNFIRNPEGKLVAIDVQARLKPGSEWKSVIPFPGYR